MKLIEQKLMNYMREYVVQTNYYIRNEMMKEYII